MEKKKAVPNFAKWIAFREYPTDTWNCVQLNMKAWYDLCSFLLEKNRIKSELNQQQFQQ